MTKLQKIQINLKQRRTQSKTSNTKIFKQIEKKISDKVNRGNLDVIRRTKPKSYKKKEE